MFAVYFPCVKKKNRGRSHFERADQFHERKQNNIETCLISRVFSDAINLPSTVFPISFVPAHKQAIYSFLRCTALLRPPPRLNKDVK